MTDLKSNNEFDNLEAFFHKRLKDASFAPAEEAWQQIEAELELMEKQRRRRRFLWFFSSGLVLLCGLASLWFFVLDEKFASKPVAQNNAVHAAAENKNTASKEISPNDQNQPTQPAAAQTENAVAENKTPEANSTSSAQEKNTVVAQNKTTEPARASVKTESADLDKKIQLAACSKKANPAMFNKLPYKVIEVESADGYIRYFADVPVSDEALATIHEAGFSKAFVKKNYDAGSSSVTVKDEGVVESNPSTYVAANTNPSHSSKTGTGTVNPNAKSNVAPPTVSEPGKEPAHTYNANTTSTDPAITEVIPNPKYKSQSPPATTNNGDNNAGNASNTTGSEPVTGSQPGNTTDQNTAPPGETKSSEVAPATTKTDSLPPTLAGNENKTDSLPKKTEPTDSTAKTVAVVTPAPFTPEWALLLIAGPNIFTSGATSNLYPTSGESQPVTVNTELKVQFKPFKNFSFSGGFNYTQFSSKQATTDFYFDKNQKNDYIFYSAFGPMAVPMSTVMEGFSPQVPFDTLRSKYSQVSKLNMLNIPLEMNFHFLNKSRIGLYVGVGANSSFALSQQGTLTLHKENFDNNVSYNSVTVNRFSMSLILSLGCDVRVGKRIYLTFVPSYRYGLTNLSATGGTTFAPAYFSGNAGLKFKF